MRQKVLMDVDTGIDDALALLYLLASSEAEVVGIAATAGNVPAPQVAANTLGLLELCRAPAIEVAPGSPAPLAVPLRTTEDTHGPHGIGYARVPPTARTPADRSAAELWVDRARAHPGELLGVCTGPLTNLALALRLEPRLPRLLRRLVIMGGAFHHPGNTTPTTEWNVHVDPEAWKEVCDTFDTAPSDRRPLLCGLDVTETIAMTPQHLSRLAERAHGGSVAAADDAIVRFVDDAVRFYFEFHRDHGQGYLAHMHDPFAVAVALDPDLARVRPATVDVELTGRLTRGATIADPAGLWGRQPNADIVIGTDPEVFFDRLIARVGDFARATRTASASEGSE